MLVLFLEQLWLPSLVFEAMLHSNVTLHQPWLGSPLLCHPGSTSTAHQLASLTGVWDHVSQQEETGARAAIM